MLSLRDFYILYTSLAGEVQRLLPLPATVDFACIAPDGSLHPLHLQARDPDSVQLAESPPFRQPRLVDDQLVIPLELPSGDYVAVVISDVDPALLKKMSAGWLREMRKTVLLELELAHWGYIDPESDLYNRRAAEEFLQESPFAEPVFFLLLNTVFYRRTAAGNLQKLREIADLLQALTRAHCFSFGYGVFGVVLAAKTREDVLQQTHYLQHQLKREGLSKVQVGFAQLALRDSATETNLFNKIWRALTIAEQRGPFGLCDLDALDERLPHPFQLGHPTLLARLHQLWRGLSRFVLVMISRQPVAEHPMATGGDGSVTLPNHLGVYVGEEDNLTLVLIPDINPEDAEQHVQSIREHYQQLFGDESELVLGVAAWPCLDFNKSEIPGNCLKALLHSSYLGHGITVLFDHISLNVSGDFFFDEGDYRAAIREYRRGLRLQPGDLNLMNSLGVALIECGQERKAAICFQEVLAQDSSNYMALVNLGHVQYALGRKEVALARFEQAYRVMGTMDVAAQELLVPLGKLYAEFGEHGKARSVFEHWQSCPGSENEFLLYRLLAQSYYANGLFEDAIQACQKALRLFPQDSISLSTLGLLYVEQGEGNDIGLNLCRKALALDNFNPDHWYRLGRALLHTGDQVGALAAAKHCLQLQKYNFQGMLLLSRIYSVMKKNKLAERMVMKVLAVPGASASQKNHAQQALAEMMASSQSN